MNCLVLILLWVVPHDDVLRESVDLIELNHFYDEHGRLVFDQVIFYRWDEDFSLPERVVIAVEWAPPAGETLHPKDVPAFSGSRYNVRAWRLVKNPEQLPRRDWDVGGYVTAWADADQRRKIHSPAFRETWTQYDPELLEREYLPKEKRRELRTK